ncbi:condensation domain-containing protein [Ruminococcus flavefaciens]|uniref:Nonribosomal peptide synthase n=1 Tax=Ruminococcus flavefaciens TaxID=1265 RepID=A0A1M7K590_RUMFL|nr:condensation domain-containing protein [Ruminococcus flavefaciens]SHM60364.1 Nonribosomal peptide synthase [Ruminococcus flavefaciens]
MNKILTPEEEIYILKRLNYYKSYGINLWADGEKLKFRSEQKLSPEMRDELMNDKELLLGFFLSETEREADYFSLTPIQSAYITGCQKDYELGGTNAHYYVEYEIEDIDIACMQKAINRSICDNDALRLVVCGDGRQRVLKSTPEYLLELNEVTGEEGIMAEREKWSHHIYHLGEWPMFHFGVTKKAGNTYILHFSFDCIIMDAWSAKMLLDRIFSLYRGENVPKLDYSFEKYMRQFSANERCDEKAEKYWDSRIDDMPECPVLDYKCNFSDVGEIRYKRLMYRFSAEDTVKLYDRLKKIYITPSVFMCTIFLKVMSHYSSKKDITIDLTLFNRMPFDKEVNETLGDFTNIGFASYHAADETFMQELQKVSAQFWKLLEFHDYDGTKVLKKLGRRLPGKALMPIVFTSTLQGFVKEQRPLGFREVYAISQTPQTAIDHQLRDDTGALSLSWDYITELFDEEYINKIFEAYIALTKKVMFADSWDQIISTVEGGEG